ncbi:MAG: hydrogenase [Deltaproteobacteria bacterium]|nr:hydrogenase [Deltaproteobacteria bacterium]
MNNWIEIGMLLIILGNFSLLGSSRLGMCIRVLSAQGIVLGILPFLFGSSMEVYTTCMALIALVLKGGVFPWLLLRALHQANVRREVEPFIGYTASLITGVAALLGSFWLDAHLGLNVVSKAQLAVPVSFFTILTGLFLLITRKKALTQVMGYLVLENGIYAFGTTIAGNIPFSVELGVLLDVWVAIFAMGVATYQINREFDHTDVDKLNKLKG